MSSISKEDLVKLSDHSKIISIAQLTVENSKLRLELEQLRFENYKLNIFRKYNITSNMLITNSGEIKKVEKAVEKDVDVDVEKELEE